MKHNQFKHTKSSCDHLIDRFLLDYLEGILQGVLGRIYSSKHEFATSASANFATPIGYQSNLIVLGLGGYSFRDFLRVGLPLNLLFKSVSVVVIPLVLDFQLHVLSFKFKTKKSIFIV